MVLEEQGINTGTNGQVERLAVRKRDGRSVPFDRGRIAHAIEMAYRAEIGVPYPDPISAQVAGRIDSVTAGVVRSLPGSGEGATVEEIQDEVERQLMAAGAYAVARRYILYREARARARDEEQLRLRDLDGQEMLVNRAVLRNWIQDAAVDLGDISIRDIEEDVLTSVRNGMALTELDRAIVLAGRSRIERLPVYSSFAARALLRSIYSEVVRRRVAVTDAGDFYAQAFVDSIHEGAAHELYSPDLLSFDLARLGAELDPARDLQFRYLGLQTLYDRYLVHNKGRRIELPQTFWMRVAMGLALATRVQCRHGMLK